VSGIAWDEGFLISVDRYFTKNSRYNWFQVLVMLWRLNDAKVAGKKIFETEETLSTYMAENGMADLHPLQATVHIMREQFTALVRHWYSLNGYGVQLEFDESLKATGAEFDEYDDEAEDE
jgi:hypothetical protein